MAIQFVDQLITWDQVLGRIETFRNYVYPVVGKATSRSLLAPVQIFEERLMSFLLTSPNLELVLQKCRLVATRPLTLFQGVVFKNCITYIWDQVYVIYEFYQQSYRWKRSVEDRLARLPGPELEMKAREELKEAEEDYKDAVRDQEDIAILEGFRSTVNSRRRRLARLKPLANERKKLQDELNETKERNNHLNTIWNNMDQVILALQILDLWKGWMTLRHSYLELFMDEYIAMRYLPLSMLYWVIEEEKRYIQVDLEEDEHRQFQQFQLEAREGEEVKEEKYAIVKRLRSNTYVRIMQDVLQASSYTIHPVGVSLTRAAGGGGGGGGGVGGGGGAVGGRLLYLVYPIWNYGGLVMRVCDTTGCV